MSELPRTQPTTDLSWASSGGTKTPPDAGQQTDGWSLHDQILKGNHNWMWDAFERFATWLFAVLPRAWDDLPQCIDGTAAGSLFMLEVTQDWSDDPLTKPSKHGSTFPITFLTTDCKRLYYVQNDELIAVTNRPSLSTSLEWSVDLSSGGEDMGVPVAISTDGRIVMLVTEQAVAENSALMLDAATGNVLRKTNTIGAWDDVVADSDSAGLEAYLVEAGNANIYSMTDLAGPAVWRAGQGSSLVTTTPTAVVIKAGVSTLAYDKGTTAQVGTALYGGGITAILSDGAIVWSRISLLTTEASGPHGGVLISGPATTAISSLSIDDRYLYATSGSVRAADKLDGSTVHTWASVGTPTEAVSDGRYLWINSSDADADLGHLTALPLPRAPSYFLRLDGGASGDYPYPMSMRALATPIARDTI